MCMFCAAIPAALAVGANVNARQRRETEQAQQRGEPPAQPKISPKPATAVIVAGLAVASVMYHTHNGF